MCLSGNGSWRPAPSARPRCGARCEILALFIDELQRHLRLMADAADDARTRTRTPNRSRRPPCSSSSAPSPRSRRRRRWPPNATASTSTPTSPSSPMSASRSSVCVGSCCVGGSRRLSRTDRPQDSDPPRAAGHRAQTDTGPGTAAARPLRRDCQWPSSGPPPTAELTSEREEPEFDPPPDLDRSTELTAGFDQRLHESEQFAC